MVRMCDFLNGWAKLQYWALREILSFSAPDSSVNIGYTNVIPEVSVQKLLQNDSPTSSYYDFYSAMAGYWGHEMQDRYQSWGSVTNLWSKTFRLKIKESSLLAQHAMITDYIIQNKFSIHILRSEICPPSWYSKQLS
jgi:hypothetical protein